MNPPAAQEVHALLLEWFERHQRSLPWRDDPEPYRVLVSEVMLQQTQI
jgi:A/G-specific adenine glycosylase